MRLAEQRDLSYVRHFYSQGKQAYLDGHSHPRPQCRFASYRKKPVEAVIASHEREKRKHAQAAAEQRRKDLKFFAPSSSLLVTASPAEQPRTSCAVLHLLL